MHIHTTCICIPYAGDLAAGGSLLGGRRRRALTTGRGGTPQHLSRRLAPPLRAALRQPGPNRAGGCGCACACTCAILTEHAYTSTALLLNLHCRWDRSTARSRQGGNGPLLRYPLFSTLYTNLLLGGPGARGGGGARARFAAAAHARSLVDCRHLGRATPLPHLALISRRSRGGRRRATGGTELLLD